MAQNNNVRVNLQFTADTGAARRAMDDLQTKLQNLTKATAAKSTLGLDKDLQAANKAATDLLVTLEKSTNVNTGKLDLGRFSESLKKSGKSLDDYYQSLLKLGTAGEQAFESLALNIMQAETPLRKTNKLLDDFWTNLKKTAGWTISSNIIHGLQGALQHAYGYAKDLNESLNNIRIVTGQSTDQMAKFAKQANEAAKSLSTTTTAYTNASLIYYQQGLSDKEVMERTEVTVKMANAAGVSAETVSDQLTSVWNNFYDGSKSLEYYADVMTALGAATASSTDEISEGLEKFASVANTIGLSYEYATASLATITATTRESANVVGTALKTLFSRIQGLSLGETLDDGTDLNKYSNALNKVGISIFDQNHQLKEMDDILNEMGNKWDSLARDQKMALAQTVAGVRQYTQLITLMDNWDYFQENLTTATGATGALDQQADIYAESWEAASKRVQASAESIYGALLNDEFFIKLTNFGADVLDFTKQFIDSMGGVQGLLLTIGTIATRVFNQQIAQSARDAAYNIGLIFGKDKNANEGLRTQASSLLKNHLTRKTNPSFEEQKVQSAQDTRLSTLLAYQNNAKNMTNEQQRVMEYLLDQQKVMVDQTVELQKQIELKKQETKELERQLKTSIKIQQSQKPSQDTIDDFDKRLDSIKLSREGKKRRSSESFANDFRNTFSDLDESTIEELLKLNTTEGVNYKDKEDELGLIIEQMKARFRELATPPPIELDLSQVFKQNEQLKESFKSTKQVVQDLGQIAGYQDKLLKDPEAEPYQEEDLKNIKQYLESLKQIKLVANDANALDLINEIEKADITDVHDKLQDFFDYINQNNSTTTVIDNFIKELEAIGPIAEDQEEAIRAIRTLLSQPYQVGFDSASIDEADKRLKTFEDNFTDTMKQVAADGYTVGTSFATLGTNIGGVITAVEGLANTFADGDFNSQDIMSIGNVVGQLSMFNGSLKEAHKNLTEFVGKQVDSKTAFGKTGAAAKLAGMSLKSFNIYVIAAVAAIAAIGIGLKHFIDYLRRYEIAAEKAAEAAKKLNATAQETKQKFDNLKSSFDAYDTVVDKLNNCVKGTQEWRDALEEVNGEVLNILQNHPELASKLKQDSENGGFTQESIEAVLAESEKTVLNTQAAALMGNVTAAQAQQIVDERNLNKSLDFDGIASQIVLNAEDWAGLTQDELREKGYELANKFNYFGENADRLVNNLLNYADEVEELASSVNNIDLQLENTANALADSKLGDEFSAAAKEFASEVYESTYETELEAAKKRINSVSWANGKNNKEVQDIWKEYTSIIGVDYELANNAVLGKDTNRRFQYWDNGEKKTVSAEEMAATMAAAAALEELGASAKEAVKYFNSLTSSDSAVVQSYLATGSFDNLSQEQLNKYKNLDEAVIREAFKLEELVSKLGLTGEEADEYIADFITGITSIDFESIGKDLSIKAQQSFKGIQDNLGKLSANEQAKVADWIQSAYEWSGEAGAQEAASAFKDITASLGKDAHKLDEAFESINWNSIDDINDLKDNLIALEIPVDNLSNTELQALIDAFYKVGEAAGFAANATKYAALQDVKDAVNFGNNLSEEQFKEIPDTLKHMFVILADGTYKFTGILADFNAEMNKASEADHRARIKELQEQIRYLQSLDENTLNDTRIFSDQQDNIFLKDLSEADKSILTAQLKYLGTTGFENSGRYLQELTDGTLTAGSLREINAALDNTPYANNSEFLKSYYSELEQTYGSLAASSKNLNDLQNKFIKGSKSYESGLKSLAYNYSSCRDELDEYNKVLNETPDDIEKVQEAQEKLEIAIRKAQFDQAANAFQTYGDTVKDLGALDAEEIAAAQQNLLTEVNNLLGTNLGQDFIDKYNDVIIQAAQGDEVAKQQLIEALTLEIPVALNENSTEEMATRISNLVAALNLEIDPIKFETILNSDSVSSMLQEFYNVCSVMWGISEEARIKINEAFSKIGYKVVVTGKKPVSIPVVTNPDGSFIDGGAHRESTIYYPEVKFEPISSGDVTSGLSDSFGSLGATKSGGGGSSSGPSEYKTTSKDDIIDRYKEEDDRLDDINDALDDYNRLMDRSYGQGRLNQMAKLRKALDEEKKAIEAKKAKALEYLQVDKEALEQTAKQHGVNFNFDNNGNIINYTETMENLFTQLEAAEAKANSFTSKEAQDKYIEASITPIKTKIEELKEVIAQYEETRELIEDLENDWEEVRDKEYANNYAELSYKIELRVELNEMDMDLIEYQIAQLGEGFFKSEEILALMGGDKLNNLTDGLKVQQDAFNDLQSAIEKDEITQADYVEGLKEAYQSTMDLANAVLDLDKEMLEYYSNTLDKANEELDKYTNNLEHLTSVLDHYKNIMGVIGKETDYEAMGKILDARVITTRNELDIAKQNYAMMAEEVDKWAAKMNEATGEKELELYTKNWEAANEKMQEAQDEMLSKTEAWAEAMREQIENALNLENRNLEKILTGEFGNFDQLITSMDRAQSLQDNYLTETNKIYELDKLVNKAQQEIDKTNNQIAKQKLKAYIDETESLEDVNQLSKYNLEIQQAKLDLVMAEIALEEAQNAKSVVRLSRDSEGNYGYVYTADQNKVSQAEQDFADAQNNLYNIGLRGSTEFAEKYAQTLQEMYDTLGELQEQFLNGEFESEKQYNEAVMAAKQFYFAQLKAFQDDYTLSFTTHDQVRTDSWGTSYETMIDSTQEWEEAVNQNIENVSDQFSLWEELSTEASQNIKDGLDEVTESSEALADQIEDEILPAIEDEIDLVGDLTAEYAELRDELVGAANDYLQLADAIREALAAEQNKDRYEKSQKDAEKTKAETSSSPGSDIVDKDVDNGGLKGNTSGASGSTTSPMFSHLKVKEMNPVIVNHQDEEIAKTYKELVTSLNTGIDNGILTWEQINKKRKEIQHLEGLLQFDTGGYTGSWGPDGRWALLHQKELVLNQEDTSNILSAVGIIRHIIDSIDLQSAYQRLAAPSTSFFGAVSGGQIIDQNVSIEATFPSVQDRHEIEEAFNNLINTASQYAFRR